MSQKLSGKTAIVTGGSAGIGLAIAKSLYKQGVNVVIVSRDREKLENAKQVIESQETAREASPRVVIVAGDLKAADTAKKLTETALEHFGQIDFLINNAGSARAGVFLELPDEAFTDTWELKLLGYIRTIRAVMPHFIENKKGSIVNIVGGAGRTPSPLFLAGSTTNAALLNFAKGISKELAKHQIRINSISPGLTATERAEVLAIQEAEAKGIPVEKQKAESASSIPLGRLADPDDIAELVLFLISDKAKSITGEEIIVDGGSRPGV